MRKSHADKLLGDLYEFAVELVRDPDNMQSAAWRARDLRDILDGLPAEQRENAARAIRRYLWAVYDGSRPPPPPAPTDQTAAATAERERIGERTRMRICAAADLLRRREPGISMRQASIRIAGALGHAQHVHVYRVIRAAFSGQWDDQDAGWIIV